MLRSESTCSDVSVVAPAEQATISLDATSLDYPLALEDQILYIRERTYMDQSVIGIAH